jgi:hypothetical protein
MQAVLPFGSATHPCLREGYRSIQLQNIHSNVQELSALLVHIQLVRSMQGGGAVHAEAQQLLRDELGDKREELQDLIRARAQPGASGFLFCTHPPTSVPVIQPLSGGARGIGV